MADKAEKEKVQVEPVAKKQDFFEWLEKLYDGTTQFPEKLLTCVVKGRYGEQLVNPPIKQIVYRPQANTKKSKTGDDDASEENVSGVLNGKPTREQIVKLSNLLLYLCQRDCDQHGKEMRYGIHAMHFSCDPEIYERSIVRMSPQGIHAKNGEESEDEEETDDAGRPVHKRYAGQALDHDERMFTLNAEMSMGSSIGNTEELERTAKELADTREDLRRERDMAEKERAQNHQRMLDLQWNELQDQVGGEGPRPRGRPRAPGDQPTHGQEGDPDGGLDGGLDAQGLLQVGQGRRQAHRRAVCGGLRHLRRQQRADQGRRAHQAAAGRAAGRHGESSPRRRPRQADPTEWRVRRDDGSGHSTAADLPDGADRTSHCPYQHPPVAAGKLTGEIEMPMTPEQALTLLANIKKEAPDKLVAACNSIAMDAALWAQQALARDNKLRAMIEKVDGDLKKLVKAIAIINGVGAPVVEAAAAASDTDGGQRMNTDGTPMSAEDAAREDLMDAATSGMPPNPDAPIPTPMPGAPVVEEPVQTNGAQAAPQVPPPVARAGKPKNDAAPKA